MPIASLSLLAIESKPRNPKTCRIAVGIVTIGSRGKLGMFCWVACVVVIDRCRWAGELSFALFQMLHLPAANFRRNWRITRAITKLTTLSARALQGRSCHQGFCGVFCNLVPSSLEITSLWMRVAVNLPSRPSQIGGLHIAHETLAGGSEQAEAGLVPDQLFPAVTSAYVFVYE